MRIKLFIAIVILVVSCLFLVIHLNTVGNRFSISIPISMGLQEFNAQLPAGRYAIVVSTNYDNHTFGIIPPERQYQSDIVLNVSSSGQILLRATNLYYKTFNLKNSLNEVTFSVHFLEQKENTVLLNIERSF
jgi:hypothetical protein